MRKTLFASLLVLICVCIVLAARQKTEWKVPEEIKNLKNPVQSSPAVLKTAHDLYIDKCSNCHGDTGKGDGSDAMMYDPPPGNLTDAQHMNTLTDGTIFYQITEGRDPMPSFRKKLTDEQRWQLVLFVRSLAAPGAPLEKKPATAPAAIPTAGKKAGSHR